MVSKPDKNKLRSRHHKRIRGKASSTAERPRLGAFRLGKNIYTRLADDVGGVALASASTNDRNISAKGPKMEQIAEVGKALVEAAAKKSTKSIMFDRSGYLYRGRVQTPADTAREDGLEFWERRIS